MIYLERIKVINDTYPGSSIFEKNLELKCKSVNLLVGDQGCGKSTLLKMIQSNHSDIKVDLSKHALEKGVDTYYFDSEHDNPRVKDIKSYSTPAGMSRGYGVGNAIRSKFMSHGEVLENLIITPLLKAKNCVIMLDEPESGLSLKNQFKLINLINLAVKNKCQLFIATHCYPLIESFDVFSIEHKMKMPGSEFIQKNK